MSETVWLQRPGEDTPWGFRLYGGRDYQQALTVQKVNPGSIAATGLSQGDVIIRIGDVDMTSLTYTQAMDVIKNSGNLLQLSISKGGGGYPAQPTSPSHAPTRLEQQLSHMGLDDYGRPANTFEPYSPSSPQPPPPPAAAPPAQYSYGGAPKVSPGAPKQHAMPDAVMNMAAKGEPDKKPWTYAPDMESIKEQRDKVRRRAPGGAMPRYQQLLNMPQFDDSPSYAPKINTPTSPHTPATPDYAPGPGDAEVAHLQYNSPMPMYSENNVAEAFTGQTDGVVTGVSGPALKKDQGKDMTQSPVYRMIHGLDQPKLKSRPVNAAQPYMSEVAGVDEVGAYDQASIRYTGKNIPSKSFRMLQSMTGDTDTAPEQEDERDAGAFDDMYYLGEKIPSQSFHLLQGAVGTDENAVKEERRRRRRNRVSSRQNSRVEEDVPQPQGAFDEQAYLSGQLPINVATDDKPRAKPAVRTTSRDTAPWEKEADVEDERSFDEEDYLAGRVPILGNEPSRPARATATEMMIAQQHMSNEPVPVGYEDQIKEDFDEDAYLAGSYNVLGGDPKPRPRGVRQRKPRAAWERQEDDLPQRQDEEYDEDSFLKGKIHVLQDSIGPAASDKPKVDETPEWAKKRRTDIAQRKSYQMDVPDQQLYTEPQANETVYHHDMPDWARRRRHEVALGEHTPLSPEVYKEDPLNMPIEEPEWAQKRHQELDIRQKADPEHWGFKDPETAIEKVGHPDIPEWAEKHQHGVALDESGTPPQEIYREDMVSMPKEEPEWTQKHQPSTIRQNVDSEHGRPTNEPVRKVHYLRRTVSRELPPPEEKTDEEDPNNAYNEMAYVGDRIPSKTFIRLQKIVNRAASSDPMNHLKAEASTVTVERAMEQIRIGQHDPDKYMEQLKQTVEANNNIKIEAVPNEVTDF